MKFKYIAICLGMAIFLGVCGAAALAAPFSAAGIVLLALSDPARKGEGDS